MRSLNRSENKAADDQSSTASSKNRVFGVPLHKLLKLEANSAKKAESAEESNQESVVVPDQDVHEEAAIPKMLSSMLQYLETEEGSFSRTSRKSYSTKKKAYLVFAALKTEGIFRLSSNFEEMMRIKEQLNRYTLAPCLASVSLFCV